MKSSPFIAGIECKPAPHQDAAWEAVQTHAERLRTKPIAGLFADQPQRFDVMRLEVNGLVGDFSRQAIDQAAFDALHALAAARGLPRAIAALYAGETLNFTENRAALHMALRGGCALPAADAPTVRANEQRARAFAAGVREGTHRGSSGEVIRHVINLGIGGSDLGPRLAYHALRPDDAAANALPSLDFVANIDPHELDAALARVRPEHTLFIVSSKSFSTLETLANATAARDWLRAQLGANADLGAHFAAVSNAVDAAVAFGIRPEYVFALPDWVGGRFSLWSTIGLPLLIGLGETVFDQLRAGAGAMDAHFRDAPLAANLPLRMALTGIWNTNFLGIEVLAVLPYSHALTHFPGWLQQLDMESNGKRTLRDGTISAMHTAPVVFGSPGSVAQHSFHQLFYQGTRRVALDFVVIAPNPDTDPRRRALFENALAQAAALMHGRDLDAAKTALTDKGLAHDEVTRLAPHLVCPGNQPSTTLLLPRLDAFQLGQLLALYEHKVFAQGWIWGINSFDQYGVELGKEMARTLSDANATNHDPATAGLLAAARAISDQHAQ